VTSNLGSYSPGAVKAAVVPALQGRGGLSCGSGVLILLSDNSVKAKFHSQNGFKLKQSSGTDLVTYIATAAPDGTSPFTEGATVDYMQNNLLNLLGLLGGSSADLPFFIKLSASTMPSPGVYADRISIEWTWKICPGIGLLGLCVGTTDAGMGSSTIDVTLIVSPRSVVTTLTGVTTWDPVNQALAPKAIPGARRRVSLTVTNPDIVPLDAGGVAVILPTPAGSVFTLNGDGVSAGAAIKFAEGTPASGMSVRYVSPVDQTDDVDFSSDSGLTWTYTPVSADLASQAAVTHVRIRPQGAMAKQSSFTTSASYLVR
jgi:hypothetical protein